MTNIKDWLIDNEYHQKYHVLSFGKYMFTTNHKVEHFNESNSTNNSNNDSSLSLSSLSSLTTGRRGPYFGMEQYPFSAGHYCYKNAEKSTCPGWKGRCKAMVKPDVLSREAKSFPVHGDGFSLKPGAFHFPPRDAHVKEFVGWLHPNTQPVLHHDYYQPPPPSLSGSNSIIQHKNNATNTTKNKHSSSSSSSSSPSFWITNPNDVQTHFVLESHLLRPIPIDKRSPEHTISPQQQQKPRLPSPTHRRPGEMVGVEFFWDETLIPWLQSLAQNLDGYDSKNNKTMSS